MNQVRATPVHPTCQEVFHGRVSSLPGQGEGSSTGRGKLWDTSSPVFSDVSTLKRWGGGITVIQVKSGASISIKLPIHYKFFCVCYLVVECTSGSSRCSGPPRPRKKSWPSRRWDARHGQAMKGTARLFPHAQTWYKAVSGMIICKTALFNPKQRVLWKLQFPSCIMTCTTQSMKYKLF